MERVIRPASGRAIRWWWKASDFRDDLWPDIKRDPLTEAAKITEHFRGPNFGSLEIEVTVNDPKAYTKPLTVTLKEAFQVDTELADEICLENEKSVRHMTGK